MDFNMASNPSSGGLRKLTSVFTLKYELWNMFLFCCHHHFGHPPSRHCGRGHERCVPAALLVLPSGCEGELRHGQQRHPVPWHWPWHCPVTEGTHTYASLNIRPVYLEFMDAIPSRLLRTKCYLQTTVCVCISVSVCVHISKCVCAYQSGTVLPGGNSCLK